MKDALFGFFKGNQKWIIGIVVSIVVVLVLSGAGLVIKLLDASNANYSSSGTSSSGNSTSSEGNMPAKVENIIISEISGKNIVSKDNGDYKINVDLITKINELYEEFEKTDKGKRALGYLDGTEEEKKELLKKMITAEIVTQYPDLRSVANMNSDVENGEIQGAIKFKRIISESNVKKVNWIKKSEDTSIELNGGIVCWGDDFTLGNTADATDNYPTKLANSIKKDVYNLGFEKSTSEEVALMAGADGYTFEVTGSEYTIGAEIGSEVTLSAKIRRDGTLSTQIPFKSFDGTSEDKKMKCTISGISGELIYQDGKYIFRRTTSGTETTIKAKTEIKLETQSGYTSSFPIIWLGNSNSYMSTKYSIKKLIEDCRAIIEISPDTNNYVIILPTHYTDSNGQKQKYNDSEYTYMKNVFLEETGFNKNQILDLKDKIDTGYEFDQIVAAIKECLNKNNINTLIQGDYTQNVGNSNIISLSNDSIQEGQEIILEYIPLGNKLEPKPGTLMWMVNNEDSEIKRAALQYFSIDDVGNIVVANLSSVTTMITYYTDTTGTGNNFVADSGSSISGNTTMNIVRVNYKSTLSQYTMPFDYLWVLLVMGEDQKFVENIANLALDSKIEATLYDELTVIEEESKEYHDEEYNETETKENIKNYTKDKYGEIYVENANPNSELIGENDYSHKKLCTTLVVTKTNKVKYRLTFADVWCLKYQLTGVQRDNCNIPDQVITGKESEPETWEVIYETNKTIVTKETEEPDEEGNTYWESWVENEVHKKRNNKYKTDVITKTSGYTYSQGAAIPEEKTDKNYTDEEMKTGVFNEPNFVKYYLYASTARDKISSSYNWFIMALENNPNTEGMVDITKYMIYMATEDDSESAPSFDFDSFSKSDFKDFSEGFVANGDFLEIAKQCHDYISENEFYYSSSANKSAGRYVGDGTSTGNGSIPYPNGTNYTDCSAYVSWVLYEYGYTDITSQKNSQWFMGNGPASRGWIVLPATEAQPGDILAKGYYNSKGVWTEGHVEIYTGNGTYSAGSTSSIREQISYEGCSLSYIVKHGGFTRAIRVTQPD